ncbi:MAG: dTMP kinase [Actinomycetia bacterium]|nr:dTMP kinase [Actinomycetes bacterium]
MPKPRSGLFVAFEGGEGAGKSTQVELLAKALAEQGFEVVTTFEPGDTEVGRQLRHILLGHQTGVIDPRTETLLYAADRAEHVAAVVRPALERGAVCITDRYIDSSIAYQGAGRVLEPDEIEHLSRWASGELWPDLTIVLDIDPAVGLTRFDTPADRLEAEPLAFHQRVREHFLSLATATPDRYLVVDATSSVDAVASAVFEAVHGRLS